MKRLNVKLALWLVGITVFSVVGMYFLHEFQENRNAEFLKIQAEQARNEGNDLDAIKHYSQYVRHRDDREGYRVLAELTVKVAKDPAATKADHMRAYNLLEEAIRRYPDLDEARSSLVDYMIAMQRFSVALEHIATLQANGSKDPSLELKKAACHVNAGDQEAALKILYAMIGYDPETKEFLPEPPATAQEPEAFVTLARMMRARGDATEADALMNKLVEWNPDSAKAHLSLAAYNLTVRELLMRTHGADAPPEVKDAIAGYLASGKEELKRVAEIEPENADALLMNSGIAIQEQDYARAQELLDQALKLHPTRPDVYLRRSILVLAKGAQDPSQGKETLEKAAAELQDGLAKADNVRPLLERLIEIQFNLNDLPAARATCEQMKKVPSIPPEYIRYQEAMLTFGEGKVLEAMREFEQVRPAMERLGGQYGNAINTLLGRCYETLGMSDRQLEVYRRLLSAYPNQIQARIGETVALQALGRHQEAENSVRLLAESAHSDPAQLPRILQLVVNHELSKPAAERNWDQVDKLTAMLEETGQRTPLQTQLLKAELLMAQGKSDEALATLGALRKEHPKEVAVWVAICKLMTNEEKFRDRVPQLLTLAERELGDVAPLLAERIKLVARQGGDQVSAELQKLEAASKSYEPAQQQMLNSLLGATYLQVGDYENGKRCLNQAMAEDGRNLRVRQALFDLAMERKDDATAKAVIKELRESPYFGTSSASYKYCSSTYELQKFAKEREGISTPLTAAELQKLAEIRKTIDEAIALRAEWAPLWRVRGEVEHLEGNVTGAIANYQRSLNYSRAGQTGTARRLVALLYFAERYAEANEALQYFEGSELSPEMRRIEQASKHQSGNTQEALAMAKSDVEKDPENAGNYLWYGQLLEGNGDFEGAEKAFRAAVAKGPKLAVAWENLARRLTSNNKPDESLATAKEAVAALGDAPLELGRIYQRASDLTEAEKYYKRAIEKDPGNLITRRLLAEMYLGDNQIEPAMAELNKIIELGTSSKDPQATASAAWARTQKARNFAPSREYANTMEAIKLIEQNAQDGKLSRSDMLAIVGMLAPRMDEPPSRAKAIDLLEQVSQSEPLNTTQQVALARMYERHGDWVRARDTMLAALNMDDKNPEACLLFAEMLFNHEQYEESQRYVDRAEVLLEESFSQPSSTANQNARLLKARLLVQDGKSEEAAKLLENWLPRPLPQNNLVWLEQVAGQTEALDLLDAANRLYDEYATLEPRRGKLALAAFRGRQGDLEQSFALLDQAREGSPMTEILPAALTNIRSYPEKVTPEQFKQLEQWALAALEQTNDPERIKLLIAELYDLQSRYDEVIKIYRDLLADEKTSRITKAIVQNNLAFVLAAAKPTPQNGAEAQKLIEQAITVLGPTSDLLDTRAIAFLAQGKVDQAAAELRIALEDRPTTSKYYHLAQVEKKLGNVDAAKTAMTKAEELHGERNQFTPLERRGYEQLKRELN